MGRILPRQAYATYGGQFPRSRPAAPIDAIVPWGLVGWWTMDVEDVNFAAGTVLDRSGNGLVGALSNLAASSAIQGQIGQALQFNGTSSKISVANTGLLNPTAKVSLLAWVNPTGNTTFPTFMGKGVVNTSYELLAGASTFPTTAVFRFTSSGGATTATNLSIGKWWHVAGTYDGANLKIYLNGALSGTAAQTGAIPTNSGAFTIGASSASGFSNAGIDDVRIYNRALDQGEILQLYAAGLAGMGYWSGLGLLTPAPATSNLAPQRTLVGVGI